MRMCRSGLLESASKSLPLQALKLDARRVMPAHKINPGGRQMKKHVRVSPPQQKAPPRAAEAIHWNQAVKRFHTVTREQAERHARDPMRWIEPYQVTWLENIIFPTVEKILNARGEDDSIVIGEREFDLPVTLNAWDPVITPAMWEVVRRRYSIDEHGKEVEVDPLDSLAVSVSQLHGGEKRVWVVVVHPRDRVVEFR